jgi:predicted alpha-1,2-mannosidase
MPYLYNYAGQPWKTQYWVRQVIDRMYKPTPDGYCGDEDNGQTSAWYVFSALGFYPVCPATDEYVLGAPFFKKATLTFENGKTLTIDAPKNSAENVYVNTLQMNGKDYGKNWLSHKALHEGGTLNFDMAAKPNYTRGSSKNSAPYSMTTDLQTNIKLKSNKKK